MKRRKVIVITGGSSGIGFACAQYLLEAGYDVIITGKSSKNLELALQRLGNKATDIRVNVISPGVTESPIQQKSGMSDEAINELLDYYAKHSPIGRTIQPADIGPVLEFLVSDRSLVLRNEKIIVDGGTTM